MELDHLVQRIRQDLLPCGMYLQKRIVPEGKQGLNIEPYLAAIAVFVVLEFAKGFLGALGQKFATLVSKSEEREQLDIGTLNILIREARDHLNCSAEACRERTEARRVGIEHVKSYLCEAGVPSYRAEAMVNEWKTDLYQMLDA